MARPIATLLLSLALLFWVGDSAECTDAETATAESVWAAAAATSSCSPYVTQTDPVYVNAPCFATDCVAVVEGMAKDLPDCTFSGINNKIEVQNALTACNGGDTKDAGSLTAVSTDAPEATASSGQMDSSTLSSSTASSSGLTSASMASSGQMGSSTLSPSTASSSGLSTGSTGSNTSCTTAEAKSMWDLYISTARSDVCTEASIVDGSGVDILTQCRSDCAGKIKDLADELPDCFYDYEYMNKKQDVLSQLDACNGTSTYVSATIYPDSSLEFASSSGSTLESQSDMSGSEPLRSGDNPSDNALDSSSAGSESSASPPREGKLHLWVMFLVGIIAVFVC